jgi:hypothetical protein
MSRSWMRESAGRRSGSGPHRPARAWRERNALALAEGWAEVEVEDQDEAAETAREEAAR